MIPTDALAEEFRAMVVYEMRANRVLRLSVPSSQGSRVCGQSAARGGWEEHGAPLLLIGSNSMSADVAEKSLESCKTKRVEELLLSARLHV